MLSKEYTSKVSAFTTSTDTYSTMTDKWEKKKKRERGRKILLG